MPRRNWLIAALLVGSGCGERVELLKSSAPAAPSAEAAGGTGATGGTGAAGDAGDAGAASGGTGTGPFTWTVCEDALMAARPDEPCDFEESCFERDRCCARSAACSLGRVLLREGCDETCLATCQVDADCEFGTHYCEAGQCVPCATKPPEPCPYDWTPAAFPRNGCLELMCAPPSECHSDPECGDGNTCYPGRACAEGCAPFDPRCCEGNFCAATGCDPLAPILSCADVGCPMFATCRAEPWVPAYCACDGGTWACEPPSVPSECL